MENVELAKAYKENQDKEILGELYAQNTNLFRFIAKRYSELAELDDLMQEAFFGVHNACMKYDYSLETDFNAYMGKCVRSAILHAVYGRNRAVKVPPHRFKQMMKYKSMWNDFKAKFGCNPTRKEMSLLMRLDQAEVDAIEQEIQLLNIVSLDTPLAEDVEELTIGDMVPDMTAEQPFDKIADDSASASLWGIVDELPSLNKQVIKMRYIDQSTRKEIANKLGLKCGTVQSAEEKAMQDLRKNKTVKGIAEDYNIYSRSVVISGWGYFHVSGYSCVEKVALDRLELAENKKGKQRTFIS